jgi:hypothetical protein
MLSRLRVIILVFLAVPAAILVLSATPVAAQPKNVALIIANSRYEQATALTNPPADANLIKNALTAVGFSNVAVVQDATRAQMEGALRNFSLLADQADVALIYYAGHGMELNNTNYLIPVDARLARDRDAEMEAVKLDTLMQMVENTRRLRIVILDACRNNPFDAKMVRSLGGTRAVSRGLAAVEPVGESLVVYAAKAGKTAADGTSGNSPFARALARRLIEPGLEISFVFRKVRDDVLQETSGEQEPFQYGSLSGQEFYFVPPKPGSAPAARVVDMETEAWDLCKTGATRGPCDSYISRYAGGRFEELARARLSDFGAPAAAPGLFAQAEAVAALGIHVRGAGGDGITVDAVDPRGIASGQLFPGDIIMSINSASPDRSVAPASQLSGAMGAQGRIKLLVKRGPSTSIVILRK